MSSVIREIIGKVVSVKMNKSIVVQTERKVKHPLYGKYVRKFSRLVAHDESNECHLGDIVAIRMSRPLSKTKTWIFHTVVKPFQGEVVPASE